MYRLYGKNVVWLTIPQKGELMKEGAGIEMKGEEEEKKRDAQLT